MAPNDTETALADARAETDPAEACFALAYLARATKQPDLWAEALAIGDREDERDRFRQLVAREQARAGDAAAALRTWAGVKKAEYKYLTLVDIATHVAVGDAKLKKPIEQAHVEAVAALRDGDPAPAKRAKKLLGASKKPIAAWFAIALVEARSRSPEAVATIAKCSPEESFKARAIEAIAAELGAEVARPLIKKLKDPDERAAALIAIGDVDAAAALEIPRHRKPHVAAAIAIARGALGAEADAAIAAAAKLEDYHDGWWVPLDIAVARHRAGRDAKPALRTAGELAARDTWTAAGWVGRNEPNGFDKLWRVVAVQAAIDPEGSLATARRRRGGRRAAGIAEAIAHRGVKVARAAGEQWCR